MKKLNKSRNTVDNSIEAYGCTCYCVCSCECSCFLGIGKDNNESKNKESRNSDISDSTGLSILFI